MGVPCRLARRRERELGASVLGEEGCGTKLRHLVALERLLGERGELELPASLGEMPSQPPRLTWCQGLLSLSQTRCQHSPAPFRPQPHPCCSSPTTAYSGAVPEGKEPAPEAPVEPPALLPRASHSSHPTPPHPIPSHARCSGGPAFPSQHGGPQLGHTEQQKATSASVFIKPPLGAVFFTMGARQRSQLGPGPHGRHGTQQAGGRAAPTGAGVEVPALVRQQGHSSWPGAGGRSRFGPSLAGDQASVAAALQASQRRGRGLRVAQLGRADSFPGSLPCPHTRAALSVTRAEGGLARARQTELTYVPCLKGLKIHAGSGARGRRVEE